MSEFLRKRNGLCYFYGTKMKRIRLGTVFTGTGISPETSSKSFFCTEVYPSVKLD